jgi:hypothetical protein
MDELTRERYCFDIPWVEKRRRVLLENPKVIAERRRVLCGYDLVPDPEADVVAALERERRLVDVIRRAS